MLQMPEVQMLMLTMHVLFRKISYLPFQISVDKDSYPFAESFHSIQDLISNASKESITIKYSAEQQLESINIIHSIIKHLSSMGYENVKVANDGVVCEKQLLQKTENLQKYTTISSETDDCHRWQKS